MSQGSEIPPPNKRRKSGFDANGGCVNSVGNEEENGTFTGAYNMYHPAPPPQLPSSHPQVPAPATHAEDLKAAGRHPQMLSQEGIARDTEKYRSNLFSMMGKHTFPKYVAQIASSFTPDPKEASSALPPDSSLPKSTISTKRDIPGTTTSTTTSSSTTITPTTIPPPPPSTTTTATTMTTNATNTVPQAKTLITTGNTNNRFFGGMSKTPPPQTVSSGTAGSATIMNSANGTGNNTSSSTVDGTGASTNGGLGSTSNGNSNATTNNNNNGSSNNSNSSISGVIGNIGLLGTWFPPPQAKWFRIDTIHDIEKQALPDFFSGKNPTKTPQIYKEYRDFMITSYRQNIKPPTTVPGSSSSYHPHHTSIPSVGGSASGGGSGNGGMIPQAMGIAGGSAGASATSIAAATAAAAANPAAGGISFTMCRRYLTGDVSAIYQVYRFLEHWGLIANHKTSFVSDGTGSLPLECPVPGADPAIIPSSASSSLSVAAEIASSNTAKKTSSQPGNDELSSSSSSLLPVKVERSDDGNDDNNGGSTGEAQEVDYGSHHCVFIEHTAGIQDIDEPNGNRWIRYEEIMGNEKDIWTDQETFLLLEALKTHSSWADVSRYVVTKTPRQCFEHFLKLPINPSSNPRSSTASSETSDDGNAVDALAELILSTHGCTDALTAADAAGAGDGLGVAARVGLGIARARAAELAKEEDAAIEELLAEAIDAQSQKVDLKLRHLSKYERLLQGEWKALSEIKNSLLSEKVVLVSSIIKNDEAANAAAAAAAAANVGIEDGTADDATAAAVVAAAGVDDMVGMDMDMNTVQQDQQEGQQQNQEGQNDNQEGQQQDQQHQNQQQEQQEVNDLSHQQQEQNLGQQGQQDEQQQQQQHQGQGQEDVQESQQDSDMVGSLGIGGIDSDELQAGGSQFMGSPSLFSSSSF